MAVTSGNCFICGKTVGKTAIKNHILRDHNSGEEECFLIKAEGAFNKGYWLYFSVPVEATLLAVDDFLRLIWCECCGHLSAFRRGHSEVSMSRKLSLFIVGDTLSYEYDFGSTTWITITVVDELLRQPQKEKARLLARNAPPPEKCVRCGAPATQINSWGEGVFCNRCAKKLEEDEREGLLPITNSPRSGECGYTGDSDRWTFDPSKPFPQPIITPPARKRRKA
jgi:hypothetical protein